MGVERHHGDARLDDAEVLDERTPQGLEVADDLLARDAPGDLRNGDVFGDEPHAQHVAAHDHHRLAPECLSEELRVARVAEIVALDRLLVEGGGDHGVDMPGFQILDGGAQCLDGGAARFGRGLPWLHGGDLSGRHEIDLPAAGFGGRGSRDECDGFRIAERISVKGGGFRRSVDDRSEEFRHARVAQRLENHLPADAVRITLRDAYLESVFRHSRVCFNLQKYKIFRMCKQFARRIARKKCGDAGLPAPPHSDVRVACPVRRAVSGALAGGTPSRRCPSPWRR